MLLPILRAAAITALGIMLAAPAASADPAPTVPEPSRAKEHSGGEHLGGEHLGIGDRVALRVFGRPEISGSFDIGPSGFVRLPLLGATKAAGRTPDDLEQEVTERLSERLDYSIQVTVDVDTYRPIFVVGEVSRPGQHPFLPGMTVLQAFATAGGQPSVRHLPPDQTLVATDSQYRLRQAQSRLRALLVSRAALDAALSGTEKVTLPPELQPIANVPSVVELISREQDIITAERERLEMTRDMLLRQHQELDAEVTALVAEGKSLARQQAMVNREVSNMQTLRDKGLTTNARMLDLEQSLAGIEATRYRQTAYLTRARQAQVRLKQTMEETREEWRRDLLRRRLTTVGDIEIAQAELEAAKDRMAALSLADTSLADMGLGPMRLAFTILRNDGNTPVEIRTNGAMPMRPGDILEVKAEPAEAVTARSLNN